MADDLDKRSEELASRFLMAFLVVIVLALLSAGIIPQTRALHPPTVGNTGSMAVRAFEDVASSDGDLAAGADLPIDLSSVAERVSSDSNGTAIDSPSIIASNSPETISDASVPIQVSQSPPIGIQFDLADFNSTSASVQGDQIQVKKSLMSKGDRLGSITVTIDEFARNYATPGELQSLPEVSKLSKSLGQLEPEALVSFSRLRELGIDLRYDPIADHIILAS
ncbi:hypothetical protein [uncultured Erythrobacter sp.]|uniref:hypothetical protein n=1 Tax=uncultured Erythrobacter sp. TaxID=263913 RepID=UPI00260207B1|nr:hypothetical protein [uncultured Erythrobacter sp.]